MVLKGAIITYTQIKTGIGWNTCCHQLSALTLSLTILLENQGMNMHPEMSVAISNFNLI